MKLQVVSDLHLEFSMLPLDNAGADVLILAGDILVAEYFLRGENSPKRAAAMQWLNWMEDVCSKFSNVIYILGNHEHYYGKFYNTKATLDLQFHHIKNLHILDIGHVDIDGYRFIGGTLWTDFDNNSVHRFNAKDGMNDYRLIEGTKYRKLQPKETEKYHHSMLEYIKNHAIPNTVVVGHHTPSFRSVHPEYRYGPWAHLNHAYFSNLDKFIEDNSENIPLWIHGHSHDSFDYMISKTRVLSNPRGYQVGGAKNPENLDFNPSLIIGL